MDTGSVIESLILIGLSALGLREGIRLLTNPQYWGDPIGPGGYVAFFSAVLFINAAIYLVVQLKSRGAAGARSLSLRFGRVGQVLVVLGLYSAAVPIIGYAASSALFFVLALRIFGVKSWMKCIAIGLAVALTFELVFSRLAKVPFP